MKEWKFENGIEVYECKYDCDLHCFKVYNGSDFLGTIYPSDIDDMSECIKELDKGHDPISYGWEDGLGNSCDINGWGK